MAAALFFAAACEPGEEETIPVLTVGSTLWKAGGGSLAVQVAATSTWKFEVEYAVEVGDDIFRNAHSHRGERDSGER